MRGKNSCYTFLLAFLLLFQYNSTAQSKPEKVYRVNRKVEIPVTVGLFGLSALGFNYLAEKDGLSYETAVGLSPEDVWWFDRSATKQDASGMWNAHRISDVALNASVLLPAFLGFNNTMRKDWFDLLILYGESHAITSNLYILNSAFISRARPFNYNSNVPVEEKMANESRNSWYSGHVASAATASFFMAKVYSDYHPEMENKKYWLFAAALVPPSVVGIYRYKAMKHFPTDIIVGAITGATTGILIPHLHKNNREISALKCVPFAGKYCGLQLTYKFP